MKCDGDFTDFFLNLSRGSGVGGRESRDEITVMGWITCALQVRRPSSGFESLCFEFFSFRVSYLNFSFIYRIVYLIYSFNVEFKSGVGSGVGSRDEITAYGLYTVYTPSSYNTYPELR